MNFAQRIVAVVRILTGAVYFLWSLVLLTLAAWLIWPIGDFWWLSDVIGAAIAWWGINCMRSGCDQLLLNRSERPPVETQQKLRR
jgi:hypothetical protein